MYPEFYFGASRAGKLIKYIYNKVQHFEVIKEKPSE